MRCKDIMKRNTIETEMTTMSEDIIIFFTKNRTEEDKEWTVQQHSG